MKNNKTLLAGAALAGIITGCLTAKAIAVSTNDTAFRNSPQPGVLVTEERGETHACAGKNSCKGRGGCTTGDNGCVNKNSCKGKGGCAMTDDEPITPMPSPMPRPPRAR
jgi:hypothetical protein